MATAKKATAEAAPEAVEQPAVSITIKRSGNGLVEKITRKVTEQADAGKVVDWSQPVTVEQIEG